MNDQSAGQIIDYLSAARAALGTLPTQHTVVFERFFDDSGGMQLVVHAPFGGRINRALGLALRKRFCTKFNFELQAAATEDAIVISLSTSHSFPLESVAHYLNAKTVRPLLVQAMLDAPMFGARWRWVAGISLALPRFRGGKKVPPQLQRMRAEDLLAAVFPDQIACAENLSGPREIPDHPLVDQVVHDCLYEAMDIEGLERLLADIESGAVQVVARDLTEPSPLAAEILTARPYAYLDDAPLEERRANAVMSRRWLDDASAADLGRLDVAAIDGVRAEAWPEAESADELHDALLGLGFVTQEEADGQPSWPALLDGLVAQRRATRVSVNASDADVAEGHQPAARPRHLWVAAERLPQWQAIHPACSLEPRIDAPLEFSNREWAREAALVDIVRGRLEGLGPTTVAAIADSMSVTKGDIDAALAKLMSEGVVMSGLFTPGAIETEWCERSLLARIHRYTVKRLRGEIEPVSSKDFLRFLFRWQHLTRRRQTAGPRCARCRRRATAGIRGAGGGVGIGNPSRAARRLRIYVARRSVPFRPGGVDASYAKRELDLERTRADTHDACDAAAAPQRASVGSRGACAHNRG